MGRRRLRRLLIRHGYAVPPSLTREGRGRTRFVASPCVGRGHGTFVNVMLATQANALGKAEGIVHLRIVYVFFVGEGVTREKMLTFSSFVLLILP